MPRKIAVYDSKSFEGITDIMARHPKAHIHGIVRAPPVLLSRKLNQSILIYTVNKWIYKCEVAKNILKKQIKENVERLNISTI